MISFLKSKLSSTEVSRLHMRRRLMPTAILTASLILICSGVCMALTVNVKDSPYNAQGDGSTNDTAAIQAAVTAVIVAGADGTVNFPAGTYIISMVEVRVNAYPINLQTLPGDNRAVVKMKDMAGDNNKMFTTCINHYIWEYKSANDSGLLKFTNLEFDCNAGGQGAYHNYEVQHQAAIGVQASTKMAGRIRLEVDNCYFHDGAGDGINILMNTDVKLHDFTTHSFFRGAITFGNGHTTLDIDDWTDTAGVDGGGLQVETDGAGGYGGDKAVHITITNATICSYDLKVIEGSTIDVQNLTVNGPFQTNTKDSTSRFTNCSFSVTDQMFCYYPNDMIFDNCTFYATHRSGASIFKTFIVDFWIYSGDVVTDQTLLFKGCNFLLGEGILETDTTYGIYQNTSHPNDNNLLRMENCTIADGFDYGVFINAGGIVELVDIFIDADIAVRLLGYSAFPLNATLDNVIFGDNVTTSEWIAAQEPANVFTHLNMVIDRNANTLAKSYSTINNNTYNGGRKIIGTCAPGTNTPAFQGDHYRLDPLPGAGQTFEWVATSSSVTGATWNTYATMPSTDTTLLAHWKFDELLDSSSVYDCSGHGKTGTLYGNAARTSLGHDWRGMLFDGSGDYVDMGDDNDFDFASGQNFTFSAWFFWDGTTATTYKPLVNKGVLTYANSMYLGLQYNYPVFRLKPSSGSEVSVTAPRITPETWVHVVGVRDDNNVYIYINGELKASKSHGFTSGFASSYPFRIGKLSYSTPGNFPGIIDDMRVYTRALSAIEVMDLYEQ